MRRKGATLHALKRPKIRQSWNKINLYNLSRYRTPVVTFDTLYKQKWVSKSASRKYHGETLREKPWTRLFRPMVRAVVPMNPTALAADDGRKESAGRGRGLERLPQDKESRAAYLRRGDRPFINRGKIIPYANMTYAPLERRLDTAVFRALFASSTRQARQFCVHGFVKVNGQKMIYPGYMLNPGDMFQVDPERVMFAAGAGKDRFQRREGRIRQRKAKKGITAGDKAAEAAEADEDAPITAETSEAPVLDNREALQRLLDTSKVITSNEPHASAKRKRAMREFTRLVRKTLSQTPKAKTDGAGIPPKSAVTQLQDLMSTLNITIDETPSEDAKEPASSEASRDSTSTRYVDPMEQLVESNKPKRAIPLEETQTVKTHQHAQLATALQEARENPIDPSKPYGTPWRPRPYMSAFAFVPRYLEVHHAICSAVYIRHPVARPGLAEVPTPFENDLLSLAHNWYLRRR